jgi:PKD repeat protein
MAAILSVFSCAAAFAEPVHPRLLFQPEDVPALRARAAAEPFASMVEAVEWMRSHDPFFTDTGEDRFHKDFGNPAILYLFTGETAWADLARDETLYYISRTDLWANTSYSSLRRGALSRGASISYDFCYHAWAGQTVPGSVTYRGHTVSVPSGLVGRDLNEVVSEAILQNAQSLMASGGSGWPGAGKYGNNWYAVRYSGAGIGFLATDHPFNESQLNSAIQEVLRYVETTHTTRRDGQGWNPEGHGYAMFPGQYTFLFEILLNRHRGISLGSNTPSFNKALWAIFQGGLPYPVLDYPNNSGRANLGFHPDFTDDNVNWNGEGTANLAFYHSPEHFVPGLKWVYRRVFGDLGDNTWDASSMGGLYALLYYPYDIEEQNPADIPGWGRWYYDPTFGMTLMRNRFQDDDDSLVMFNGKFRSAEGGHNAPDGLGFRIAGEGHLWTTGSGRTTNPRGQTIVFRGDPEGAAGDRSVYSERFGTPREVYLRNGGGGIVSFHAFRSDVGVRGHTRRLVTDFDSHVHGASAVVLVDDATVDGEFWRLNTPGSNTIEIRPDGFVIHSLDGTTGPRLIGTVLRGDPSTLRQGTFARGSANFFFRNQTFPDNKWVDFVGEDGQFLVALVLVPAGADEPTVEWSPSDPDTVVISAPGLPGRTYHFAEEAVTVSGWERPTIAITSPADGAEFIGGSAAFTLTGTASDSDGFVEIVEVYVNGEYIGDATYEPATETFAKALTFDELGDYLIQARAIDDALEYADSTPVLVRVTNSLPPRLSLDRPGYAGELPSGETLRMGGTVFDEDGVITHVRIYNHGDFVGNATVDAATSTWTYNWSNFPFGRHAIEVRATDNDGDETWTEALPFVGSKRFNEIPHEGDAANWSLGHGETRWRVVVDDGGSRYSLGPSGPNRLREGENRLLDRPMDGDFRFEFDVKTQTPLADNPQYQVYFGNGIWLRMTNRGANASTPFYRFGSDNGATSIQMADAQHTRWVAYGHGAGISSEDWQRVVVERTGNDLRVEVDGVEILNTGAPDVIHVTDNATYQPGRTYVWSGVGSRQDNIALAGPVGVGNFFNTNSILALFDNLLLTDPNAPARPEITLDAPASPVIAVLGEPLTLSGTFAHAGDRPTEIEVYVGALLYAVLPAEGDTWTLDWTPERTGDYSIRARAMDNRLEEGLSEMLHVRVTTDGTGTLTPPTLTVLQPGGPLSVAEGAGALIEVTGSAGSAPPAYVAIYRDGVWLMDARRLGTQARWVAELPTGIIGEASLTAKLHDDLGQKVLSAPVSLTTLARGPDTPVLVNFRPAAIPGASGYHPDHAAAFGDRGYGLSYGWTGPAQTHERNALTAADRRTATGVIGSQWQLALEPGFYSVRVVSGNPANTGSITSGLFVQGEPVYTALPQPAGALRDDFLPLVEVTDGFLSITANPPGQTGQTMGLYYVEVTPIDGGNLAPIVSWLSPATDTVFPLGTTVPLSVEAIDIDGTVESVVFSVGGDSVGAGIRVADTNTWSLNWVPGAELEGFVFVTATATDNEGATRVSDVRRLVIGEVSNEPPVALFTANPVFGDAPLNVSFNASASNDPDGEIVSYHWAFGTGQTGSGVTASHTFHTPGVYEVILTVTDNGGATDQRSVFITVTDPAEGGVEGLRFLDQPEGGEVGAGQTITLSARAFGPGPITLEWYAGPVGDIAASTLLHTEGTAATPAPLVYDGFVLGEAAPEYVAGTALDGKNPVIPGFTGAWSGAAANRPLTLFGTMEYADIFGNELLVSGGRVRQSTTQSNHPQRTFNAAADGPLAPVLSNNRIGSGRVFVSHLLRWERTTSFTFGFRNGGTDTARLFMDTSDGNSWKVSVGNEVRGLTAPLGANTTHLIVWEFDFEAGVTRFHLNPELGGSAPEAMIEIPGALPFNVLRFGGNREYEFDEFRLGTTFAAVTPFLTLPAPLETTWTTPPLSADTTFWVRAVNAVGHVDSEAANVVVSAPDPFAAWLASLPEDARGPMDDPHGTGLPNRLRYGLGLDPLEAPSAIHFPAMVESGGFWLVEWPARPGVEALVEISADLDTWTPLEGALPEGSVEDIEDGEGGRVIRASLPAIGPIFVRLAFP